MALVGLEVCLSSACDVQHGGKHVLYSSSLMSFPILPAVRCQRAIGVVPKVELMYAATDPEIPMLVPTLTFVTEEDDERLSGQKGMMLSLCRKISR